MNIYGNPEDQQWFIDGYKANGKKLDMRKSCARFSKVDDLPIELIGQAIARTSVSDFIEQYKASRARPRAGCAAATNALSSELRGN